MENSKNKARYGAIAALIIILAAAIALTTCKPMFLQNIAEYVPVYSQVVGPEGGTVTDSRGASVEIPAGALAEATPRRPSSGTGTPTAWPTGSTR